MMIAVRTKFVASISDTPNDIRLFLGDLSQHVKRTLDTMTIEKLEYLVRIDRDLLLGFCAFQSPVR